MNNTINLTHKRTLTFAVLDGEKLIRLYFFSRDNSFPCAKAQTSYPERKQAHGSGEIIDINSYKYKRNGSMQLFS